MSWSGAVFRVILFFEAMASYLAAWARSLHPGQRRLAPLGMARFLILGLGFPLFMGLQLVHWLCLALDELLFPAYRRQSIDRPVFILGVPRSGTTYLHRELAADPAFTTTSTWELIFAPSLTQRVLLRGLGRLDRLLGGPLAGALHWLLRRGTGELDAIHEVGLDAAEEDYLALLPAAGCFFALLAFPGNRHFAALADLSELPPGRRARLLNHYRGLLQRHVYAHRGLQLLSKNAAFAGWSVPLRQMFPDAVILLCIREPLDALSSQLSSLNSARSLFAVDPAGTGLTPLFQEFYRRWFHALEAFAVRFQPLIIEQEYMARHSPAVLQAVYRELGRTPPRENDPTMQVTATSRHRHSPVQFGLDSEQLDSGLLASYSALRKRAAEQR